MSAYCTNNDIELNMKGVIFSASSSVTTAAVEQFIVEESASIDLHLQKRYSLPIAITEVDALNFLKKICVDLVIWRVTKVLQPKSALPVPDSKVSQDISHNTAYANAIKMLKAISMGEADLPFLTKKSINLFSSSNVNNNDVTTFVSSEQQW